MKTNLLLITLITLSLSACQSVENFKNIRQTKEPVVTKVENYFDVSFEYSSSHLNQTATMKLDQFIMKNEISRRDDLLVLIPEQGGRMAQLRAEKIAAYFRHVGLKPKFKLGAKQDQMQTVQVQLDRYVVTVPRCPDWSQDPTSSYNNQASSNFGCAQAANLALMIGNPKDLIVGRESSLADGVYLSNTIQSYRTPKSTSSTSKTSSGEK